MKSGTLKLAHISDTHICMSYQGNMMEPIFSKGMQPGEKLKAALSKVMKEAVDCLVISGDVVHEGTLEDYEYVKKIVDEETQGKIKVIYACGNHDRKQPMREGLGLPCKDNTLCFVEYVGDYRIVVLDSAVEGKENGTIDAKQEAWLKDVFRENFGQGTIIVFHHPIVWEIPQLGMPVSESFAEIIKNSDTIGILCGHTHSNNIRNWNGVTQYTADSLAFGMEVGQDNIAFVDKVGINIYNIEAQEIGVHTESINPAKQVFAEFSMADMMKFMK